MLRAANKQLRPNTRGSLYMIAGSIGTVVNDGFVRRATESNLDVYQVLCLRSLGLAAVFGALSMSRGERTRRSHLTRPVLARVGAEVTGAACFFAALVRMDFANAQAILQVVPFAVTLVAAVFFGERVSARRYLAVALGFGGMLIIVRPATDGFTAWSLMAIAAAAFLVARELATRSVPTTIPATSIAFVTALGLATLAGLLATFNGWTPVDRRAAAWIVIAVVSLTVGYFFTIETVRVGELSASAPFRYSLLLGAVIVGYLLFDEVPDRLTIIGCAVIVASGTYGLLLERNESSESTNRLRS